jgi:hypothetical protein
MHAHVLTTYNHTGERPQGCQDREHVWRQLLKLVAAKVQIAVAKRNDESSVHAIAKARKMCLQGFAAAVALQSDTTS